ncbi:hypothetical protein BH09PSE5_BH09PSE5_23990 [soil metagenome]
MQASPTRTPMNPERRFPLDMRLAKEAIHQLYEDSKTAHWVPSSDIAWNSFDAASHDKAALEAARAVWSRRAWLEYTGLAETPALLIRFCLELDREIDPKFFLTVRNTDEAWHVECFHRYAQACGGYIDTPANAQWQTLFNRGLDRDALDAQRSLDGHVLTHCTFGDGLEHVLAAAWLANTTEPVARALLERCVAARERHARFGWLYMERRAPMMLRDERSTAVAALVEHLNQVELKGLRCIGLAYDIDASTDIASQDAVARAGLGAVTAVEEVALFRQHIDAFRDRLATIGLQLPLLDHPALGQF